MTKFKTLGLVGATLVLGQIATVAQAADVTWNVSLWGTRRGFTEHVEKLAEEVKARTDGQFELVLHYGEALSKSRENLDGIAIGAFEMAQFCASYHPGKTPTLSVLDLPFLGVPDLETQVEVDKAIYSHPIVVKDLARWSAVPLMSTPLPQYNFMGKGAAPATPDDFAGMRVRALGGIGEAMESVGAVPTTVTASETYQALDSGTVRAASFAPHAHLSFKTVEVSDWYTTNMNPGSINCPVVANADAFAALPDAYRQALLDSIEPSYAHYLETYAEITRKLDQEIDARGIQRVEFTAEDLAAFRDKAGKPKWDEWTATVTADGIDGAALLSTIREVVEAK